MTAVARTVLDWVEQGLLPDRVIRAGIRRLCESRLAEIDAADAEAASRRTEAFMRIMDDAPIALLPELANAQHYEVPERFFGLVLGPRRKYSSAFWPAGTQTLADAETAGLTATCEYAGIADGHSVLELGCGWGSLTRWMAERYPASRIVAVSNSRSQREWILRDAAARGLANIRDRGHE
jgi:cyclopropane-fatty-acyl-phospholipid synthase